MDKTENGSATAEMMFVLSLVLVCLAAFFAAGIRAHDAALSAVGAEAFLMDETMEAEEMERLAERMLLGDGTVRYGLTGSPRLVSVRTTTEYRQTSLYRILAGQAPETVTSEREISRERYDTAVWLRGARAVFGRQEETEEDAETDGTGG